MAMTQSYLPDTYQLTADLTTSYNFPYNIIATNLCPDLVVWSDVKKRLYIRELTICYETGFYEASGRVSREKWLPYRDPPNRRWE